MDELRVTVADGKYTVVLPRGGGLKALRHGEEWRDCCGDGLILALAAEIDTSRTHFLTALLALKELIEEGKKGRALEILADLTGGPAT